MTLLVPDTQAVNMVAMESDTNKNSLLPSGFQLYGYEDPYEDYVGPFGFRAVDGKISFAFQSDSRHRNTGETIHGGMLMSFADYVLCLSAIWEQPNEKCVTVSCNCEFVAAGRPGDLIEATGEVVRRTRSLTFGRGQIFTGDRVLLTFSGIVKRIHLGNSQGGQARAIG